MRTLTIALAATAALAVAMPAQAQRMQGGAGAPGSLEMLSLGVSRDSMAERRIRNEVKALRREMMSVRNQNGGVLPEAERDRFQVRYNELRKALNRAG
jgi:hypothetical protein